MDGDNASPPDTAAAAPDEAESKPQLRKKSKKSAGVSQLTGTRRPEMRQDGLQIDGFGLPVNRIARRRVLQALGAEDPIGGAAWKHEAKARQLTEKFYG